MIAAEFAAAFAPAILGFVSTVMLGVCAVDDKPDYFLIRALFLFSAALMVLQAYLWVRLGISLGCA